MRTKRIFALILCTFVLFTTAFASDYSYGSGEAYTAEGIIAKIISLIGMRTPAAEPKSETETDASFTGGAVYISADAFVLGGDYIIYPTKVELAQGDTAASVLLRAIGANNIYAEYDGSETADFYLTGLGGVNFGIDIEPELEKWLDGIVDYYEPESFAGGILSCFDITNMSGWLCTINGEFPSASMSGCAVYDGDVIALRFSLAGGMDLGGEVFGGAEAPYIEAVNRDEVTKAVADGKLDYMECVGILNKASATQEEIDGLLGGN